MKKITDQQRGESLAQIHEALKGDPSETRIGYELGEYARLETDPAIFASVFAQVMQDFDDSNKAYVVRLLSGALGKFPQEPAAILFAKELFEVVPQLEKPADDSYEAFKNLRNCSYGNKALEKYIQDNWENMISKITQLADRAGFASCLRGDSMGKRQAYDPPATKFEEFAIKQMLKAIEQLPDLRTRCHYLRHAMTSVTAESPLEKTVRSMYLTEIKNAQDAASIKQIIQASDCSVMGGREDKEIAAAGKERLKSLPKDPQAAPPPRAPAAPAKPVMSVNDFLKKK